ncbi:hypothetical protein BGZ99_003672 [Dissophora globulifera]|uniref:PH domain-containing protein n=1 Tax=Dissophora globulifera TaxID=979702 RepID=A0A9P6RTA1_9FUNG|nr:hypothetical protein BGZ99_003672 [Dissophora globulifera]
MATSPSSILSTHSGHHRIFIGPVVQKPLHHYGLPHSNGSRVSVTSKSHQSESQQQVQQQQQQQQHQQHQQQQQQRQQRHPHHHYPTVTKPWWEQGAAFLLPLRSPRNDFATRGATRVSASKSTSASTQQQQEASIPQLSYTFSDDNSSDTAEGTYTTEDEAADAYDSDEEQQDYGEDHDEYDDESDVEQEDAMHHMLHPSTSTSSSESVSARVGHSPEGCRSRQEGGSSSDEAGRRHRSQHDHGDSQQDQDHDDRTQEQSGQGSMKDLKGKGKANGQNYELAENQTDAIPETQTAAATSKRKHWRRKERHRTRSLRDEGEENALKRMIGRFREGRHNQGLIEDPSETTWENEEGSRAPQSRVSRYMTSGALVLGHHSVGHGAHHPVLESSPLSSEIDLPGTNINNGKPLFSSSPASSLLNEDLSRPEPHPIQPLDGSVKSREKYGQPTSHDRLHPGSWNRSSSTTSSLSPGSPLHSKVERGATWMTARETASSIGRNSADEQQQPISDEDDRFSDADDHFSITGVISSDNGQGSGVGTTSPAPASGVTDISPQSNASVDNPEETPAVGSVTSEGSPVTRSSSNLSSKESLTGAISRAGTRFGKALLKRNPTALKRSNRSPVQDSTQGRESICTPDKEHQSLIDGASQKQKKHVRFLTKVQSQIGSSRRPTLNTTHPMVKQDRMLVRKEVTERPGPHVFDSETARKLERQSQGWREWWCVMKGPPVGTNMPVTKIRRKSKKDKRVEKGRLEFYYNQKRISGTVILSSCTTVSVYSALDYSIAVTQNYPETLGLTVYILRPRTIALSCAWFMEIYTVLHGTAPIPNIIELAVPDFDVKVRIPIPEDSDTESDIEYGSDDSDSDSDMGSRTALSSALPNIGPQAMGSSSSATTAPFHTAQTTIPTLPQRMATKTFFLTTDDSRPKLVAPDEVTPRLLRSHALSLLKHVPDWMEVVKRWQDPAQHGDVALCWKRFDRIEWIYWSECIQAETGDLRLQKEHIGLADGSDWSGRMDNTVVGPQLLDKTHVLELRPITHYPSKVKSPGGVVMHEPDPIEGFMVRVSTFAGNPIRRFRRLYLTSHDHMLIYTVPTRAHSPNMQHAANIDPSALTFCITPHRSVNPDHKDMSQSRSVRRLKAQVRAARGYIDMTKIESIKVLKVHEWDIERHLPYKKRSQRLKKYAKAKLGHAASHNSGVTEESNSRTGHGDGIEQPQKQEEGIREPDSYFYPIVPQDSTGTQEGSSSQQQQHMEQHQEHPEQGKVRLEQPQPPESSEDKNYLSSSEPLHNSLPKAITTGVVHGTDTLKEGIVKSTTFVADLVLHNDTGVLDPHFEDSNVIQIEMENGSCVRFRAFSAEAAHLWCDQLDKLAKYWKLRKHHDVRNHMYVAQANSHLASSMDDDEIQFGETIQEWDNDSSTASTEIWNWCVVNGCRSITKSGMVYYKPKRSKTFRKIFLVLTEGCLMLFHPHRRSKVSGQLIPTTASRLFAVHSLTDIYVYSGHFSDTDTTHGTNDESERLPRYFPDGLIVDDPDEDCTFSIWRGKRRKMFSRRGPTLLRMSDRAVSGSSRFFGKDGLLSSVVKEGIVYGATPESCSVFRARSRPDLEEWVVALNTEVERVVRSERRRIRATGH